MDKQTNLSGAILVFCPIPSNEEVFPFCGPPFFKKGGGQKICVEKGISTYVSTRSWPNNIETKHQ